MRVRSLVALVAILVGFGVAHAGPKQDIQSKINEAMENYDLMDYDAARKLLTQALAISKKAKLDKDPVVARTHLSMGIVAFANQDQDAARLAFLSAVSIDPKIQIDPAYKSVELAKLLEQARIEASGGPGEPDVPASSSGVDCAAVQGLEHKIIDSAPAGEAQPIDAFIATDVVATKIAVMYRPEGATEFREVKLKKEGDCKYTGAIPGSGMKGSLVHYYVAAFNEVGKPVASKGSSGSPNIIELSAATGGGGDNENPIGTSGGGVSTSVAVGPSRARLLFAVTAGGGSGYVTGETEGMNQVKNCCLGGPIVVIQPEIGFFVSPQLSIGIAGRFGLPVGANVEGHATAAPGGLARVRYALSPTGEGLRFMGQAGIGVMRNTIKLDNGTPGMDTDIVAQGPLLIGAGVGYARRLTDNLSFIGDMSVLGGLAAFDMPGLSPIFNSGFGIDLSLGLQVGL
jgi:hypothetical protein